MTNIPAWLREFEKMTAALRPGRRRPVASLARLRALAAFARPRDPSDADPAPRYLS